LWDGLLRQKLLQLALNLGMDSSNRAAVLRVFQRGDAVNDQCAYGNANADDLTVGHWRIEREDAELPLLGRRGDRNAIELERRRWRLLSRRRLWRPARRRLRSSGSSQQDSHNGDARDDGS